LNFLIKILRADSSFWYSGKFFIIGKRNISAVVALCSGLGTKTFRKNSLDSSDN
jgi:hypothetical protein